MKQEVFTVSFSPDKKAGEKIKKLTAGAPWIIQSKDDSERQDELIIPPPSETNVMQIDISKKEYYELLKALAALTPTDFDTTELNKIVDKIGTALFPNIYQSPITNHQP